MLYSLNPAIRAGGVFLLGALFWGQAGEVHALQSPDTAELRGTVTLGGSSRPVRSATVTIIQLERSAPTDEQGSYEFLAVTPGSYDVISHMHALTSQKQEIEISAGQRAIANFELSISPIRNEITVTASGREETVFDAFQSVAVVNSLDLGEQGAFGLGDVVSNESGVHKRSFGPGSSRPVVRGFDGDRVLILSDGLPTGTLSSQSGEHAEPVDAVHLDRIEVIKGPATLLYGSNAIGGVVNMVTEHHLRHEHAHAGLRGQVTALGATNSNLAAGHASAEYGYKQWLFWGSGSRQVTGDYSSPDGRIDNSKTRMASGSAGLGWFSDGPFLNLNYAFNKGRLGIPLAGEFHSHHEGEEESHAQMPADQESQTGPATSVDETFAWQNIRFNTGMRGMRFFFEELKIEANFSRWQHEELEDQVAATSFDNRLFNWRTTLVQRKQKILSGTSGFQLFHRDYAAEGEEALSPPVIGQGIAFFTLQQMDLDAARLQFGVRFDHTVYDPAGLPGRTFSGASGAAGIHIPLSDKTALVANYTHSFRAPAIEELYNHGPHVGNLAFEIGNRNLKREIADGMDLSLRRESMRLEAEANFFCYKIRDFVYLSLTGEISHGLRVVNFAQADSRFVGGETQLNIALHSFLWLRSGLDMVSAKLTDTGIPLPRIPPLRARLGLDALWHGLSFKPEIVIARDQDKIYPTETPTPGYSVLNLTASYALTRSNLIHLVSIDVFNASNQLYRNHLSFIKDLAPEIGRGVRITYSLRFF